MKARGAMTPEAAEGIAIQALSFTAGDGERLGRFLAATGIGPSEIRAASRQPRVLAGVLGYLASAQRPGRASPAAPARPPARPPRARGGGGGGAWGAGNPVSFCRDCLADAPVKATRCPACGSPRLARHPELDTLTIA